MHYDPTARSLSFEDEREVHAFHAQVSALLREATIAASSSSPDAAVGAARARALLEQFTGVTAVLNALRAHLPRTPG